MQPSLSSSFCGDDAPVFEQPWARRPLYVALNCSSGYSLASAANASTLTLSDAPVSNEDLLRVSHSSKLLEHMHDKSGGVKKIRNSTGWRRVHLVKSCDQTKHTEIIMGCQTHGACDVISRTASKERAKGHLKPEGTASNTLACPSRSSGVR